MKVYIEEFGLLVAITVVFVTVVIAAVIIVRTLRAEFGDCQGLKHVVEKVWEGTECKS